jgi:hypothetical protein
MLSHEKLMDLYRQLRQEKVLSVYLDVDQHDPAERNAWRTRLEQEVGRRRKELDGDAGERRRFEQAWLRLRERLENFEAFVPEKGWVGFATPDQVWYAENVPVPLTDGVFWNDGIRVAPYVRGLKHERPVVAVLLDSRRARIFRYHAGDVTEVEDCRADTFMGDLADVNISKRAESRTGVRGQTATEKAQRALDTSFDRMLNHVVQVVNELVEPHGFLVLGGVAEAVAAAQQALPKQLHSRTLDVSSLHFGLTDPEVKEALQVAASSLHRRYQEALLDQVVEAGRAGGRACLGRDETERALGEMRVDTLLLSRTFIREQPDVADQCVGAALAQGAAMEELSDEVAARLDAEAGGIGARLRYRIQENGRGAEGQSAGDEGDFHP